MNLSPLRADILDIITTYKKPITAKNIFEKLSINADLSNVYRGLKFLEAKGIVSSISYLGVKYYFLFNDNHGHFLFCRECQEILSFNKCFAHSIEDEIQEQFNYNIERHVFYFEGTCEICTKALEKKRNNGGAKWRK